MAFVNLPPNLQDMFNSLSDRIAKLETGPNQAMYTAVAAESSAAQGTAQAQAAYELGVQAQNEATQALIAAQAAYALGSQSLIKSANTITNASNQITGINGNGITVYSGSSSTSGARVVLNSAGLAGYNSSGTATFAINAADGSVSTNGAIFTSSTITGGSLNINGNAVINTSGFLTATGATITGTITSNAATITGGSLTVGSNFQVTNTGTLTASNANISGTLTSSAGTIGGFTIDSTRLYTGNMNLNGSTGALTAGAITGSSYTGSVSVSGAGASLTTGASNSITASGSLYAAGHTTTGAAANGYVNASTGLIARSTASSQRYKHDIVNLADVPELDPTVLYELPVRAFRFNEGYLPATDERADALVPGFIAEEVDAIYPAAADYDNGQVETWNDRMLIPGMLALIQDLHARVKELESKTQ